uniref:Tryptophan synthase beta chain-like PALP domain-containing protein n=1 Tax=Panagrolaimus sp. JU765 TaxID=591449 RepID=A0AC34Q203_9BILA
MKKLTIFLSLIVLASCAVVPPTISMSSAPKWAKHGDLKWRQQAIYKMWEERKLMDHTPLVKYEIPGMADVELIFKDESASRTGNLKHRFSWTLFMWALVEGHIDQNTTVFESSSGNTATSEAYMARLIGVPFVAVIPETTEMTKISKIQSYGGQVLKTDISSQFEKAASEAVKQNGFYINQFANAHRAEEYHESGNEKLESTNVMHEVLQQLRAEGLTEPDFFVHTSGTGGTISSIGRYVQKYELKTEVVLADTEFSIYYDYVINGAFKNVSGAHLWIKPGMAGTGFGYSGPAILGRTTSLQPSIINRAYKVPDLASTAAMHVLKESGISGGTSTGLNFVTCLSLAAKERQHKKKEKLQIVTILADSADLYESSYYNLTWIESKFAPHGGLPVFNCW